MSYTTLQLRTPPSPPVPILIYPSISLPEFISIIKNSTVPPSPAHTPVGVKDTNRDIHYPLKIVTKIPKYFEGKVYDVVWSLGNGELGGRNNDGQIVKVNKGQINRMLVSPNVVHRVMNLFRRVSTPGPNPVISLPQYTSIIHHMFPPTHSPNAPYIRKLTSLYNLYEGGRGYCTARELLTALTSISNVTKSTKLRAAFELHDTNGDGVISREEMRIYLISLFRIMESRDPEVFRRNGVGVEEVATATARGAVGEEGMDFEMFKVWFEGGQDRIMSGTSSPSVPRLTASPPQDPKIILQIEDVSSITGLSSFSPSSIISMLLSATDANSGLITRDDFVVCMDAINASLERGDDERRTKVVQNIFNACAVTPPNHPNKYFNCPIHYLLGGISLLCGGTRDSKVSASFSSISSDSYADLSQFTTYLRSAFRVILQFKDDDTDPDELATATAREAFREADLNHDGRLSFEEFTLWYTGSIGMMDEPSSQSSPNQAGVTLQVSRSTSLLSSLPISSVSSFYKPHSYGSYISLSSFRVCTSNLLASLGSSVGPSTLKVYDAIWSSLPRHPVTSLPPNYVHSVSRRVKPQHLDKTLVDMGEVASLPALIAALTVVCGGTRESKVEEAFKMFDLEGNGEISLWEMTAYLTAVFECLNRLGDGQGERPGVLAASLARQAFSQADKAHDGRITLSEFKEWYGSPEAEDVKNVTENDTVTMAMVRKIVGLDRVPVKVLFEIFAEGADEDGVIDRRTFHQCFDAIIREARGGKKICRNQAGQAHVQINRLFDVFATEDSPLAVSFDEVASGLSIMAGGDQDSKVQAAFDLYDINDDGFISFDEMNTYMTSIFKVLFEVQPKVREYWEANGVNPQRLGEMTATEAFREADLNQDGRLSFDEFKKWYTKNKGQTDSEGPAAGSGSQGSYDPADYDLESGGVHPVTMEEVQKITGLEDQHVEDVFELFASHVDEEGYLDKEAFFDCFATLIRGRIEALDEGDHRRILFVVESLFQAVDLNGDGRLDYCELASGISVLCGGGRDDKVRAAFALFDLNGDGYISLEEMVTYLTSMFSMLYQVNPGIRDGVGCGPGELAAQTAKQAFVDADLNHDGRLSFEEFTKWYMDDGAGGQGGAEKEEEEEGGEEQEITLQELRKLTSFKRHSPEEVFDVFARCTDARGMMNRDQFLYGVEMFVVSSEDPRLNGYLEEFKLYLANGLFDAYLMQDYGKDEDEEDVVDFSEVCSGLSVLCGGKRDDKALAAFRLYDVEGRGAISLDDLSVYLSAVFKLLFWLQPNLEAEYDVDPEELGDVTAKESFEEMAIGEEEGMSFEAFQEWYSMSGDFAGDGSDEEDHKIQQQPLERISLSEIRELTKMNCFPARQVVNALTNACDEEGLVDVAGLYNLFVTVWRSASDGPDDPQVFLRLKDFTLLFFSLFEEAKGAKDGSQKKARYAELACALTVIAGGSREEKVQLSFLCFDHDGDGYLSMARVVYLMATVFKVLHLSNPQVFNELGVTPYELAKTTAKSTFEEAFLRDGNLSLDEFRKWYEREDDGEGGEEEEEEEVEEDEEDYEEDYEEEGEEEYEDEEDDDDEDFDGTVGEGGGVREILVDKQKVLGLDSVTVDDLLEILSESAPDGSLTKDGFLKCIQNVSALSGSKSWGSGFDTAMELGGKIFESFDEGGEGRVDFAELTSGLSILCNSSMKDKVITTFTIHDSDADGNLSLEEATHFVTNVFKVLYACADLIKVFGIGANEMANITSKKCWKEAKIEGDLISIGSLMNWIQPLMK